MKTFYLQNTGPQILVFTTPAPQVQFFYISRTALSSPDILMSRNFLIF